MRILLVVALVTALFVPCAYAAEPIMHRGRSLLFQVVENGVVSSKRAVLEFDAGRDDSTHAWGEVRVTIFTIDAQNKRVEIDSYYCSSESGTVRDLSINPSGVAFEMAPYPFAPDRPLRVIATRTRSGYEAAVSGLWSGLFDHKPVKIEWRQVQSIQLPYALQAEP